MPLYRDHIYPFLVSKLGDPEPIRRVRQQIIPWAQGKVLEIGIGAGSNLVHYDPARVSKLYALEPNRTMIRLLERQSKQTKLEIEFLDLPGERIPLGDGTVDTVVSTFTLCTISDVAEARGLAHARERGLPAYSVGKQTFSSRAVREAEIRRIVEESGAELICLAGYMRILSPEFVARYRGRILNIHPSLLPKYRGLHPQKQALDAGENVSGCTVHLVDEGTDTGPVILQKEVPILPGDTEETLSERILAEEHRLYPEAILRVLQGRFPEG